MVFPTAALRNRAIPDGPDPVRDVRPEGWRCSLRFFDAADLEAFLGNAECIQLGAGNFHGIWTVARSGAANVSQQACNRGIQVRKAVSPDHALIGLIRQGGPLREHGRIWTPESIVAASGTELNLCTMVPSQIVWLELRLDALGHQAQTVLSESGSWPMIMEFPRAPAREALATCLVAMLNGEPLLTTNGVNLITIVERALFAASAAETQVKRNRQSFSLAERVVQFMWENVEQRITLQSICDHLHCGMRRLIYSFTDSFGVGPMRYLKILRLNAVRRKLKEARGDVRILDVAGDYGFWHMGHFSADYKRMFGTAASDTIQSSFLTIHSSSNKERALWLPLH